jgi:hypothetical protein
LVSIAIVWSVVVLPVWPTSDNRLLVSLERLSRRGHAALVDSVDQTAATMKPEANPVTQTDYASVFRLVVASQAAAGPQMKVLLVGESDDFDFLSDCTSNGPFDRGLLDKCVELTTRQSESLLRAEGVTYVLVVWSGVQYRERLTDRKIESDYRSTISQLVTDSYLTPIPWEISSSQAELFRVNEKR